MMMIWKCVRMMMMTILNMHIEEYSLFIVLNTFQLTFVDEVNNGSVTNGGRQLVPGLLYIDDKAPKYKVPS